MDEKNRTEGMPETETPELIEEQAADTQQEPTAAPLPEEAPDNEPAHPVGAKPGETPRLTINYRISLDRFVEYNQVVFENKFAKNKKRTTILGWVYIALAVLFIASIAFGSLSNPTLYIILDVLLFGMGIYNLTFYRFFFPKKLRKSSVKYYEGNEYVQNPVILEFYDDRIIDKGAGNPEEFYYDDIASIQQTQTLLMIMVSDRRCLLVPKDALGEDLEKLEEVLLYIEDEYQKRRVTL